MNKLTIIGNLTRPPELRTTSTGINVCSFSVAVNRRKAKDGTQGVDYFRVTAWRELGELCAKYLDKGRKVAVIGAVAVSTYTGNDGQTRASLDVTAETVEFLSARNEQAPAAPAAQAQGYTEVEDDDLPF